MLRLMLIVLMLATPAVAQDATEPAGDVLPPTTQPIIDLRFDTPADLVHYEVDEAGRIVSQHVAPIAYVVAPSGALDEVRERLDALEQRQTEASTWAEQLVAAVDDLRAMVMSRLADDVPTPTRPLTDDELDAVPLVGPTTIANLRERFPVLLVPAE